MSESGDPMTVLHGLDAPAGDGMVIEVHLDILNSNPTFMKRLNELGFEEDPFLDFYPPAYHYHYTGRTRAMQRQLHAALPGVNALIAQTIREAREADVRMYVESELVREIRHFCMKDSERNLSALEGVAFRKVNTAGHAKADIHVEFVCCTVPSEVRSFLIGKEFYWVRTPASERFPSEEIATIQTTGFNDARQLFERLVSAPLPACTGIHLEQKLAVIASHPDLPMPECVEVTVNGSSRVNWSEQF